MRDYHPRLKLKTDKEKLSCSNLILPNTHFTSRATRKTFAVTRQCAARRGREMCKWYQCFIKFLRIADIYIFTVVYSCIVVRNANRIFITINISIAKCVCCTSTATSTTVTVQVFMRNVIHVNVLVTPPHLSTHPAALFD